MVHEEEYEETNEIKAKSIGLGVLKALEPPQSFQVDPKHTVLENGVRFNIETVPKPTPSDAAMPRLKEKDVALRTMLEARSVYGDKDMKPSLVRFEAKSNTPQGLVYSGGHGFLAACMVAFARHLPLALKPDDIWLVITHAFATNVKDNAESLRNVFVSHQGKRELVVREDSILRRTNGWNGSPPEDWEKLVFSQISESIRSSFHNTEIHNVLVGAFSTSTPESRAASEIMLMSAMEKYFKFGFVTLCGIPSIRLDGTLDDWIALRARAEKLAEWMTPELKKKWLGPIVLPILEEFIKSYKGNVNHEFWQNMVKFRDTGGQRSGRRNFLSGWLHTLFPYLCFPFCKTSTMSPYLRPWTECASARQMGPEPSEIPAIVSSCPVNWLYFGEDIPLHFHSGFSGFRQEEDGTLAPTIGWYVTSYENK